MSPCTDLLEEASALATAARSALRSNLTRSAEYLNLAWLRAREAELAGGDEVAVRGARMLLLQLGMTEWVPLAAKHAAMLEDEQEQTQWCRTVIGALQVGRDWFDQEATRGTIVSPLLEFARPSWDEMIEGCELLIGAPRA